MKALLGLWLFCCAPLWGQIRIPASVQRMENLAEVQEQAKGEGKLVVFLMVNPAATAPHVADAFEEYVKRFRTYGPVMLVPQGAKLTSLPPAAVRGFGQLSGGYPRVVVIDPVNGELVQTVPYIRVSERARTLRTHRSAISKYQREQRAARRRRPPELPEHLRPVPPTPPGEE